MSKAKYEPSCEKQIANLKKIMAEMEFELGRITVLRAEIARFLDEKRNLKSLLKRVEWKGQYGSCLFCGAFPHAPDCEWVKAMK